MSAATATRWSSSARLGSALNRRRDTPGSALGRPKANVSNASEHEERPKSSAIRPLSGKVVMRRTVKRGWTAKAIPPGGGNASLIDLEEEDELLGSEKGSLDSFFDDDFEDQTKEEALGKMLFCNTLGVESKGHKKDWVPGGLAIPDFHCPRCRDHWYGISAFPCDEELARLIREGKWYIGKDKGKAEGGANAGNRERSKEDKEMTSGSSDSLSLPSIQKRKGTGFQINKSEHHIDFVSPEAREKKKKKQRISFKLDHEDENFGNNSSNTSLEGADGNRRRYGGKNEQYSNGGYRDGQVNGNGEYEGATRNGEPKASDVNSGSSATLLSRVDGSDGQGFGSGKRDGLNDTEDGLGKGRRKRRGGNDGSSSDLEDGLLQGSSRNGGNSKSALKSGTGAGGNDENGSRGKNGSRLSSDDGSGQWGRGGNKNREGNGHGATGSNDGSGSSNGDGSTTGKQGEGVDGGRGRNNGRQGDSLSSSQRGSHSSLHGGGSQHWGSRDKERELVKGKGYMRASSPSQSDWADPTHARIWASNTASSSRVSLASSTTHKHNKDEDSMGEGKGRKITLPPIINKKRENPFGDLSFMEGFELTRAFTFSYH
ncbi:PREDICTED: protein qua-1-like [Amphimedon queenslandica]|uniref:Uncharacterized protein n=1 Tax=Amphimedon queenslandica TaxID=400682 RepID=A0A1X7VQ99_AMPQE|nr:PREDICTED: protein qua-1-like [Amphimedon queenslandica]|eukprot:XP_019857997.1 PREDICTED: protein qua-1-like [Amphimedon queenslandica]